MTATFEMYSGDTKQLDVAITDSAGTPVSLSGASVVYKVKKTIDGTPTFLTKSTAAGSITLSGSTVTIPFAPADTALLSGTYYHELEITDFLGNVSTAFQAQITILQDMIE